MSIFFMLAPPQILICQYLLYLILLYKTKKHPYPPVALLPCGLLLVIKPVNKIGQYLFKIYAVFIVFGVFKGGGNALNRIIHRHL